jgi:hypothetical protein
LAEVEQRIDAPEQMVGRHMAVEPETVEQRSLRHLPTHHVPYSPPPHSKESRRELRRKREFFNSLDRF